MQAILALNQDRVTKAKRIAEAIRGAGAYRWVGIYDVNARPGTVSNIAWSGPNAPAYPVFPITKGLTSRAITARKTVNVGDVASDPSYLTALASTRAEIVVPILDDTGDHVIGTIDVESEHLNAFDSKAQTLLEESANVLRKFWTSGD
ncbi:MAG TPA: GAF domain-containing protein [Candidatus Saccharimonadales bacterium]|nr:GAF domain-containing protein [Candidatus Saccharimonadales bacterium]